MWWPPPDMDPIVVRPDTATGHIGVAVGAVAELPRAVETPAPTGAVGEHGAGVVAAGGDGDGGVEGRHRNRNDRVGGGPVAELPLAFRPQQVTVLSVSSAQEWVFPTATAAAVLIVQTVTGTLESFVVPSPSPP